MRFNQKTAPVILFFLIAAMLCIPLCSRADYSGVLSYTKMMKITREDGTVDSLKVPLFTVDYNGSISVESMKDTPYYSWANKCDYQYKDGMLKCDEIIDDLISKFSESGFDSLYMTRVKSCYRARLYDEILITLFTTEDRAPEEIFEGWFRKNNKMLEQEEFAYEKGDRMIIGRLYHE